MLKKQNDNKNKVIMTPKSHSVLLTDNINN